MPDDRQMRIEVTADTSGVAAGMKQAQAAAESAAKGITAAFTDAAAATRALDAAQARMAAALAAAGGEIRAGSNAARMYAEAEAAAAQATAYLAAAQEAGAAGAAAAAEAQSSAAVAGQAVAASAREAATSTRAMNSAMAYGSARMVATAGGAGSVGYALASVARNATALQPILDAIFYPAAAIAIAQIIGGIAEAVYKWYQNTVELTGAIQAMGSAAVKAADAAAAANERYIRSEIAVLNLQGKYRQAVAYAAAHEGETPLKLTAPPTKGITGVPGFDDIAGKIGAANTLTSVEALRGPIEAEMRRIAGRISELRGAQGAMARHRVAGVLAGMGVVPGAATVAGERLDTGFADPAAQIKVLSAALKVLGLDLNTIRSDSGAAFNQLATAAIHATKPVHDVSRAVAATKLASGEKIYLEIQGGIQGITTTAKGAANSIERLESTLRGLDQQRAQFEHWQKGAAKAATAFAALQANGPILGDLRTGKAAGEQPSLDKSILGGAASMGLGNAPAMNARLIAEGKQIERVFKAIGTTIDRTMDTALRGVIMGTERVGIAFRRLGADIATALAEAMLKVLVNWAVSHAEMKAISAATSRSELGHAAAVAAGKAYSAEAGIPIVGPILGAAAAAATFAAVMAFGTFASAAGGQWRVPAHQMTMLHANEMVLPAQHAEGLRQLVSGGGAAPRQVHFHFAPTVNAVDGPSVRSMLDTHQTEFAGAMRRWMRAQNV